ncbi:pyrethroid hydrolase Ces2a-like [Diadema setosum]|uniref:pyrethroid hydrolase Ces2a-like n=1 Tax=Diadema setosum TaxID=31175 RepID=UPI003B3B4453
MRGVSALEEYPNFVESTTADGILRGVEREEPGARYAVYLGVPYAEPPVGSLRFMPPREISPWTAHDDGGPQFGGTTDCLTLDIYVPSTAAGTQSGNVSGNASSSHADGTGRGKAVLAYITSGDPEVGRDGSTKLTRDEIIVVVIRHRVGVFGYLSVDQELALRWIQRNVGFLGGDPNRVTLFGGYQSYVSLHLYTTSDTGHGPLFQRLIDDGGATTPGDILQEPPVDATYELGVLLNCTVSEKSVLLQCLRSRSENDIVALVAVLNGDENVSNIWRPFFDTNVMSTSITRQNVDVIVGFSSADNEIGLRAARNRNIDFVGNGILPPFLYNVSTKLSRVEPGLSGSSLLQTLIRQQYGDWSQPETQSSLGFVNSAEVVNDLDILLPGFSFLEDVTSESPTSDVYLFVCESNMTNPHKSRLLDILGFLGMNSSQALRLDEERQLSDDIRHYFINFIIDGYVE